MGYAIQNIEQGIIGKSINAIIYTVIEKVCSKKIKITNDIQRSWNCVNGG